MLKQSPLPPCRLPLLSHHDRYTSALHNDTPDKSHRSSDQMLYPDQMYFAFLYRHHHDFQPGYFHFPSHNHPASQKIHPLYPSDKIQWRFPPVLVSVHSCIFLLLSLSFHPADKIISLQPVLHFVSHPAQ